MWEGARMTVQRWQVGDVSITSVVEDEIHHIPPEFFFPDASSDAVAAHDWLVPDYADTEGKIALRVQALVIDVAGRRVLVDPCVGNAKHRPAIPFWHMQQYPFLERFEAAGFDAASI